MSQLLLRNRQRARTLHATALRRLLTTLLADLLGLDSWELGVHLVNDAEMTRLNERFLRHAGTTDVIAFNHADATVPLPRSEPRAALYGELFVCVPEALRQARRFRTHWTRELARYIVHGTLHLLGYDDATPAARRRMKREEDRLLRALARHVSRLRTRSKPTRRPKTRTRLSGAR
ncbi:MAG: rRNA maturation RNase YbeY [Verrucomicrobiae bacterium]|nr:rRNA maturation RNase YbeY [Verrucomicrobiae bacterium]